MTSPVDTSVKIFHSGMAGAPTLSGVVGSVVTILDACLVDGWGSRAITSIVVAGGIATVSYASAATPWETDCVVDIAGVTGGMAALNGEQKVLSSSMTTTTFATALADGTATLSSATIKLKSAGWTKAFTGTNKVAYKIADVAGSGFYVRVDDNSFATRASVLGFETMSDVDTGTGQFHTAPQNGGGLWIYKNSTAAAATNDWIVIADSRMFFMAVAPYKTSNAAMYNMKLGCFGDFLSDKTPDPYACMVNFPSDVANATEGDLSKTSTAFTTSVYSFVARDYTGVGGSAPLARLISGIFSNDQLSGGGTNVGNYPNNPNNGLMLSQIGLYGGGSTSMWRRGVVPGVYFIAQNTRAALVSKDKIAGTGVLAGRKLMIIKTDVPNTVMPNVANGGCVAMDITGPWR